MKTKIFKMVYSIIVYLHIPLCVYFHWWILFVCDKSAPGLFVFYFAGLFGIVASGFAFHIAKDSLWE